MKAIKFMCVWAIYFGLFYGWRVLGYEGAFNVLEVMVVGSALIFLLGQFADRETLAKPFGACWLQRKLAVIFTLSLGAALVWLGHLWLGVFYLFTYALIILRIEAVRAAMKKAEA